MAIKCGSVLNLQSFKDAEVVAGEKGLNRMLTWTYVVQTDNVSEWVHGGELLFVLREASMGKLDKLLDDCIEKNLCGIVILVGTGCLQVSNIPKEVIDAANSKNIPILQIPWKIKLIDATKEIADLITEDKLGQQKSKNFLTKLISLEEGDNHTPEEIADNYGIQLSPYGCMGILYAKDILADKKTNKKIEKKQQPGDLEKLQYALGDICSVNRISIVSAIDVKYVMFYIGGTDYGDAQKTAKKLEALYKEKNESDPNTEYHLALGGVYSSGDSINESFHQAKSALKLCEKIECLNKIIRYEELGLYRLLLKVKDNDSIKEYYRQQLAPLMEYDKENKQDLVHTLRAYLINNGNLIKTSKALYIHRNTLIYRINKIKSVLEIDLDDSMVRQELLNSIMAKEFLGE